MTTTTIGARCTVLICDDRPELRAAISAVLFEQSRFQVVGEAVDRATCLQRVKQTTPDILILDIEMPNGGPYVAAAAKALQPDLHILVFSRINDPLVRHRRLLLTALNRAFEGRHLINTSNPSNR